MSKLNLELIQHGIMFDGEVGVIEASIKGASNGNYLNLVVTDGHTRKNAKQWQYHSSEIPLVGSVIRIKGIGNDYKGIIDLSIKGWQPGDGDINEYRPQSVFDPKMLKELLFSAVESITNEELKENIFKIFKHFEDDLEIAPAAKTVHHDYVAGWLQHTVEVLNLSRGISAIMEKDNKYFNQDHVIAGSVLHDIGKLVTYKWTGMAIEMSDAGMFNEHIIEGIKLVDSFGIKDLNIQHIIASHHGKLEYGSPVLPATIEAFIISEADMISSKVEIFKVEKDSGNGWNSNSNYFLGRKVYRGE